MSLETGSEVPSEDLQAIIYGYLVECGPAPSYMVADKTGLSLSDTLNTIDYLGTTGAVREIRVPVRGGLLGRVKTSYTASEAIIN